MSHYTGGNKVIAKEAAASRAALLESEKLMRKMYSHFVSSSKVTKTTELMKQTEKLRDQFNKVFTEDPYMALKNMLKDRVIVEKGSWISQAQTATKDLRNRKPERTRAEVQKRLDAIQLLLKVSIEVRDLRTWSNSASIESVIKQLSAYEKVLAKGLTGKKRYTSSANDNLFKEFGSAMNDFTGYIVGEAMDEYGIDKIVDKSIQTSVSMVGNKQALKYYVDENFETKSRMKNQVSDLEVTRVVGGEKYRINISAKMRNFGHFNKDNSLNGANFRPEVTLQGNVGFNRVIAMIKMGPYAQEFYRFAAATFNYNRYPEDNIIFRFTRSNQKSPTEYLKTLSNMIWLSTFQESFGLGANQGQLISAMIINKKMYTLQDIYPRSVAEVSLHSDNSLFSKKFSTKYIPYNPELTFYNAGSREQYLVKYLELKAQVKLKSMMIRETSTLMKG